MGVSPCHFEKCATRFTKKVHLLNKFHQTMIQFKARYKFLRDLWLHLSVLPKHPSLWFYRTSSWKFQRSGSFARMVFHSTRQFKYSNKIITVFLTISNKSKMISVFFPFLHLESSSIPKKSLITTHLFSHCSHSPLTLLTQTFLKLCSPLLLWIPIKTFLDMAHYPCLLFTT